MSDGDEKDFGDWAAALRAGKPWPPVPGERHAPAVVSTDLAAFVAARLDEDEAAARAVKPLGHVFDMGGTRLDEKFSHGRVRFASEDGRSRIEGDAAAASHFGRHDPARVLREVAAGRAILAQIAPWMDSCEDEHWYSRGVGAQPPYEGSLLLLKIMAAVYDDHPDYDPAWAPGS